MKRPQLFLLLIPLLTSCHGGEKKAVRPAPLVSVGKVEAHDVPVEVKAPVDLRPIELVDVSSKAGGYLDAVLVDRGDKVRKGQLLATVRPSDLPDQLASAKAALQLARANYERATQLAPQGVISQQDLQSATAAYNSAQANLAALATRLGETRIESSIDGYVADRKLDPGALVGQQGGSTGPILTLMKTDVLRVFVTVNEDDAAGLALGQNAHVEFDAFPGKSFSGSVSRVTPAFDPVTRTLQAEVRLPNPDGLLRPGLYGRGAVVLTIHPQVPVVPIEAVQISNDKTFVYVVDGDLVHRREIKTGVDGGEWMEVTGGLKAGESVVIAGLESLGEGTKIRTAPGSELGGPTVSPTPTPTPAASLSPTPASTPVDPPASPAPARKGA